MRQFAVWTVTIAITGSSCSLITDADTPQCATAADCRALAPGGGPYACNQGFCELILSNVFTCAGNIPVDTQPRQYTHQLQVFDVATKVPVTATVTVCANLDSTCANPLLEATLTSSVGLIDLPWDQNLSAFFEVRADDYFPMIVAFTGREESSLSLAPMLMTSEFERLAELANLDADATLGQFFFNAFFSDCDEQNLAGLRFGITPPSDGPIQYYTANSLPSTQASTTDVLGQGGAFNVPAGLYTVTAIIDEDARRLDRVTTIVRNGWVTNIGIDVSIKPPCPPGCTR